VREALGVHGARLLATMLLVLVAQGCMQRPRFLQPAPKRHWPAAFLSAQSAAAGGRYADADRMLADFARAYPDTPEADESLYWRAVFKLDPANEEANTRDAIAGLDAYLDSQRGSVHRGEALTMRRLAQQMLALDRALNVKPGAPTDRTRDEEVQKLRDELQATKDELERIKRRLAAPKP
jgi:hypothetical protein